ncbi:hypothetical protein [Iamia sp.]|uniref:hypothetical protein n=1 Tax=Iamia sp. TaxID=2722710 RepID=UPI002CFB3837|nr:hypothetical protein [Iamia sp.]HXH56589.1 hypothetical protein [Iamia sp.]
MVAVVVVLVLVGAGRSTDSSGARSAFRTPFPTMEDPWEELNATNDARVADDDERRLYDRIDDLEREIDDLWETVDDLSTQVAR